MRKHYPNRSGVTAVIAMLYLVLFSTLAVGFFAAVTAAVQIAGNEQYGSRANLAAESGMQFIRYHLANVDLPHNTPTDQYLSQVYTYLQNALNNTANMGANTVGLTGNTINIPASPTAWIYLDNTTDGARFRASITQTADKLIVKITGQHNNTSIQRAIQLNYGIAANASAIFNYGVASKGQIVTAGASVIKGATDPTKGSVLSTSTAAVPVDIGGKEVSGDISITNSTGIVNYSGASVGGSTDSGDIAANHIHKGVSPPEFPTIDTTIFQSYATTKYTNQTTLDNVYIAPNTNPRFTGTTIIKGVLYVQSPNVVEFAGNLDIQGVIVVQNGANFDLSKNQLNFTGSVTATAVDTLPASYGDLRTLTGSFILAPNFAVNFSGDFGTVGGSIIASQVAMSGNAGGTVNGTVINLDETTLSLDGSAAITIASTGTTNYPSGVYFGSHFAPLPDTYAEVQP